MTCDPAAQINARSVDAGRPLSPVASCPPDMAALKMTLPQLLLLLGLVSAAWADTDTNPLDNMVSSAQDLLSNFSSFWGFEPPSSETVREALSNMSDVVSSQLSSVVRTIQTEIQAHSGQVAEAMHSVSANLNQTIAMLRSPENTQRMESLRDKVNSGIESLAQETQRFVNAIKDDTQGVRGQAQQVFDEAVRAAQQMSERVQSSLREHQAQHGQP